jgi:E3 ubiquitin-protein ligase RAD18
MLKDTALRKKMGELGLSTAGSRQMLEKRHQEWITLWNANCDSAKPKRRSELMHDLEVWERTMGSRAPTMSRAANMGAQIKDKDFDGAAWATKHDTSFKDLIAKARGSRNKAVQKDDEPRGDRELESVRDDGRGVNGTGTVPDVLEGAVVDLTGPPSSQVEPPDSPLKGSIHPPASSGAGFSPILGREVLHPLADRTPTYSSSQGPEGAPSL